jgi:GntR family transcriptional regulator, transcriptional repressor for pyruvate dehydrogenase complex
VKGQPQRARASTEIADQLRSLILDGSYRAGQRLPAERVLATDLGVNRSTIREALRELQGGGWVQVRHGDGTMVLDFLRTSGIDRLASLLPDPNRRGGLLKDIMEFRQLVGREIARLAATRVDEETLEALRQIAGRRPSEPKDVLLQDLEFYHRLALGTENLVFSLLLNTVRKVVGQFTGIFIDVVPEGRLVWAHYDALITALEKSDGVAAAKIADHHLEWGKATGLGKTSHFVVKPMRE